MRDSNHREYVTFFFCVFNGDTTDTASGKLFDRSTRCLLQSSLRVYCAASEKAGSFLSCLKVHCSLSLPPSSQRLPSLVRKVHVIKREREKEYLTPTQVKDASTPCSKSRQRRRGFDRTRRSSDAAKGQLSTASNPIQWHP